MKEFYLDTFMLGYKNHESSSDINEFLEVCDFVKRKMEEEWDKTEERYKENKLEREKRAIIGHERESLYYKEKIKDIIKANKMVETKYPNWYEDLYDGIFNELYGLSGLAPWAYDKLDKYRNSSSAKLIGSRLYCLIDGVSQLQPQRFGKRRRQQLIRSLLLATPFEDTNKGFHEVYLHNGIRITIYSGKKTKEDEEIIVFRKYVIKSLSFDEMIKLKSIPKEAADVFQQMIKIGFNVIFTGPVRSGKTTFLQSWQLLEDRNLEGLVIATDPETPWHKLMPKAPIMQLVADGEELESITKSILRGDNDYVLLEEMRDALAYNIAVEVTSLGTKRCKATIHDSDAYNIPLKMAEKIRNRYGGDKADIIGSVFRNFDLVIELRQMNENRSLKKMIGIKEYYYDVNEDRVLINTLCKYDYKRDVWSWSDKIYNDVESQGENIVKLKEILRQLNLKYPLDEETFEPGYYRRKS